jgi:LacI family transcriptional regulator
LSQSRKNKEIRTGHRQWILVYMPAAGHMREAAEGVVEAIRARGKTGMYFQDHPLQGIPWIHEYPFEGLITSVADHPIVEEFERTSRPVVVVEQDPPCRFPVVRGDDVRIGEMAFEHLAALGLKRMGYWGPSDEARRYSNIRRKAFLDLAAQEDMEIYCAGDAHPAARKLGLSHGADMTKWLLSLPRPIGIMVHTSADAIRVVVHCQDIGIAVPEDAAVVGVDDNALLCRGNTPSLTAINQGTYRIGNRAARLLFDLMDGKKAPKKPILIPPSGIVKRESTSLSVFDDPFVAEAMMFIKRRACDGIDVQGVAEAVKVGRRTLETHFKNEVGRTIHEEILRVRLQRVCELLTETRLTLGSIAAQCGFSWQGVMSKVFRNQFGMTPSDYRSRAWRD